MAATEEKSRYQGRATGQRRVAHAHPAPFVFQKDARRTGNNDALAARQ
jgi:predicted ATPase